MRKLSVLILLFLMLSLVACERKSKEEIERENALVTQYNTYNNATIAIVTEHNAQLEQVRSSIGNDAAYREAVQAYIAFSAQKKSNFQEFIAFIQVNEELLKRKGANPATTTAQLQATLDTMDSNVRDFTAYLTAPAGQGTTITTTTSSRKFQFIPLYR